MIIADFRTQHLSIMLMDQILRNKSSITAVLNKRPASQIRPLEWKIYDPQMTNYVKIHFNIKKLRVFVGKYTSYLLCHNLFCMCVIIKITSYVSHFHVTLKFLRNRLG